MFADGFFVAGEFGNALFCIQLDGHAECRTQQDALFRPFDNQVVVGLETIGLAQGAGMVITPRSFMITLLIILSV